MKVGHCPTEKSQFHPIIQIIKSWSGITEEDSQEAAKGKLESNVRRIYSEAFDDVFPFIATMMGYRLEGKAKERIKDIEGEATGKPDLEKHARPIITGVFNWSNSDYC